MLELRIKTRKYRRCITSQAASVERKRELIFPINEYSIELAEVGDISGFKMWAKGWGEVRERWEVRSRLECRRN